MRTLTLELQALVDQFCTVDQIKELMRKYKQAAPKSVILGGNKPELLDHLRYAVGDGVIPVSEVVELQREAEENGHQHVFFFTPRNSTIRRKCSDAAEVAQLLFPDISIRQRFPIFATPQGGHEWVDFHSDPNRKGCWTGKLYGQENRDVFVRDERDDDGNLVKRYKKESERVVLVVRWNEPELLEIRLPRCDAKDLLLNRLAICWHKIRSVLKKEDFSPWDLRTAMKRLQRDRKKHNGVYWTPSVQLLDSKRQRVTFAPEEEPEDEVDDPNASKKEPGEIQASRHSSSEAEMAKDLIIRSDGATAERISIHWLPPNDESDQAKLGFTKRFRTAIGSRGTNDVVFTSQVGSRAMDYVTNQLRSFNQ